MDILGYMANMMNLDVSENGIPHTAILICIEIQRDSDDSSMDLGHGQGQAIFGQSHWWWSTNIGTAMNTNHFRVMAYGFKFVKSQIVGKKTRINLGAARMDHESAM